MSRVLNTADLSLPLPGAAEVSAAADVLPGHSHDSACQCENSNNASEPESADPGGDLSLKSAAASDVEGNDPYLADESERENYGSLSLTTPLASSSASSSSFASNKSRRLVGPSNDRLLNFHNRRIANNSSISPLLQSNVTISNNNIPLSYQFLDDPEEEDAMDDEYDNSYEETSCCEACEDDDDQGYCQECEHQYCADDQCSQSEGMCEEPDYYCAECEADCSMCRQQNTIQHQPLFKEHKDKQDQDQEEEEEEADKEGSDQDDDEEDYDDNEAEYDADDSEIQQVDESSSFRQYSRDASNCTPSSPFLHHLLPLHLQSRNDHRIATNHEIMNQKMSADSNDPRAVVSEFDWRKLIVLDDGDESCDSSSACGDELISFEMQRSIHVHRPRSKSEEEHLEAMRQLDEEIERLKQQLKELVPLFARMLGGYVASSVFNRAASLFGFRFHLRPVPVPARLASQLSARL